MGLIGGLPGLDRGLIGLSLTGILDFSICGIGGFSSASIFDHFSDFFFVCIFYNILKEIGLESFESLDFI